MEQITLLMASNITKVVAITERLTDYKFYPAEPAKQKYICKWLGSIFPFTPIPYGKTEELPDRWSPSDDPTCWNYSTDYQMKATPSYKIDDDKKTLSYKASACVYNSRNNYTNFFFESDEELYYFIDEVKRLSKNSFVTITTNE